MPILPRTLHRPGLASAALILPAIVLVACSGPAAAPEDENPQDSFWNALSSHCGQAYAGGLISDEEPDADMRGAEMVMHPRECNDERIAIPFHIRAPDGSWDRSRTWLLTRTDSAGSTGLRLKHDHRHEDGSEDAVTMYGGDTADQGTARQQDFPVDAESVAMFLREGLDVSVTNVWRVEVDPAGTPDARFAYQLSRSGENARFFRVEFDLTEPVDPPPPPWGH